jgi:hypothetical protein
MSLKFKILSFIILISFSTLFAQTNSDWKPIGLTLDGRNILNGVEVFYQLNICNNEDVINIKLINHNSYAVNVEWNDAVFTNKLKWVKNQNGEIKKHLLIDSNKIIIGDCTSSNNQELVIKISDFIDKIEDFKLFKTINFQVGIIKL